MLSKFSLAAAVIRFSLIATGAANAQVPAPYKLSSNTRPLWVHFDMPSGCDPYVTASVNAWNGAGSRFRYSYSQSNSLTVDYDNLANSSRTTIQPGATDAIMTTRIRSSGGTLIDSDVIASEARLFYGTTSSTRESGGQFHCSVSLTVPSDKFDFQTSMIHELGHALGLDHTYNRACSMYLYQAFSEVRRTLCADEKTAIRGIYGT